MYTALVLTPESQTELRRFLEMYVPDWEILCHHMTINMGPADRGPAEDYVGKSATLKVVSIGMSELVMAVGVESEVPSKNAIPHVTVAVNRAEGGKPFFSNQLENWEDLDGPTLHGVVEEVT